MSASRLFIVHMVFSLIPPTRLFWLKVTLLRWAGANVGKGVRIVSSARFHLSGPLHIGEGTWIGEDVRILGGEASVRIGSNVDIGPRVTLVTGTHALWDVESRAAGKGYSLPVQIGDGAWLGACSTILGGVTIGVSSVVAAGAVVTSSVDNFTLVAGVPARRIRERGQGKPS